ncbi:hypothetical protein BJV74DRAFT_795451 [Russula compacta]|nr:hypothetical protein BJV74DRAFT_795451 [Russula compacta]
MPCRQKILYQLLESCGDSVMKHWECLKVGFGKSIIKEAINALVEGDCKMITEVFSLLMPANKSTHTVGLDEDVHKQSLLAFINPNGVSPPEMSDVWTFFANTSLINTTIHVTSRTICALLVRPLLCKEPLEELELHWLEDVTGAIQ